MATFAEQLAQITDEKNETQRWVNHAVEHICMECLALARKGQQYYSFYDFEEGFDYDSCKSGRKSIDGLVPRWSYEPKKRLIPSWAKEMFDADKNNLYYSRWKPLIVKGLRAKGFTVNEHGYRYYRVCW